VSPRAPKDSRPLAAAPEPDSRIAIFSDIHGNLQALDAVLADIADLGITSMLCLGDLVGYGADPGPCVDRIRALDCVVLLGNHDEVAAANGRLPDYWSDLAIETMRYTRSRLSVAQKRFLQKLPLLHEDGDCVFVHGSLHDPAAFNYVLDRDSAAAHFDAQEYPVSFFGHTHVPVVFRLGPRNHLTWARGHGRIQLGPGASHALNPGAVGQPRDEDPRASYLVFDAESGLAEFRRVSYDVDRAVARIRAARLPDEAAERLVR
jgi:diadenosine tetraphosphatase ApaH/serine/threonine PP2A family protein phosphatase